MHQDSFRFCVEILPQVSRTFAINIRVLNGDLHRAVLCAYLFCRIVDTAEDSENLDATKRMALLESYGQLFAASRYAEESLEAWVRSWGALDAGNPEHRLIIGIRNVVATFQKLPAPMRALVEACVIEMSEGMRTTVARKQESGSRLLTLDSMDDLRLYCHYVAGTVGQMLTELFVLQIPELAAEDRERLRKRGPAFALGLQMTNIIKDCHADYLRGWCYIPDDLMHDHGVCAQEFLAVAYRRAAQDTLNALIRETAVQLDAALEYTLAIPTGQVRIRLFNLWSLFFAIKTLRRAWDNPALLNGKPKVKISRLGVYWTLVETVFCARFDGLLRRSYLRVRKSIPR